MTNDEKVKKMRRWLIVASCLLIIHGLIEWAGVVALFDPETGPTFSFTELSKNLPITIWLGVLFGALRFLAAIGTLRNRMWGWMLAVLVSVITLASVAFYLPFGLMDGVFAGGALVTLLISRFGSTMV